eukprot:9268822-Pyramimonas_sp.AAC.4
MTSSNPFLRVVYAGQAAKKGKLIEIAKPDAASIVGYDALAALSASGIFDLERFRPFWFCQQRCGWLPLTTDSQIPTNLEGVDMSRVEVMLEDGYSWQNEIRKASEAEASSSRHGSLVANASRKEEGNHGEYFGNVSLCTAHNHANQTLIISSQKLKLFSGTPLAHSHGQ